MSRAIIKKLEGNPEQWNWRVVYVKLNRVFKIVSVFNRREGY